MNPILACAVLAASVHAGALQNPFGTFHEMKPAIDPMAAALSAAGDPYASLEVWFAEAKGGVPEKKTLLKWWSGRYYSKGLKARGALLAGRMVQRGVEHGPLFPPETLFRLLYDLNSAYNNFDETQDERNYSTRDFLGWPPVRFEETGSVIEWADPKTTIEIRVFREVLLMRLERKEGVDYAYFFKDVTPKALAAPAPTPAPRSEERPEASRERACKKFGSFCFAAYNCCSYLCRNNICL